MTKEQRRALEEKKVTIEEYRTLAKLSDKSIALLLKEDPLSFSYIVRICKCFLSEDEYFGSDEELVESLTNFIPKTSLFLLSQLVEADTTFKKYDILNKYFLLSEMTKQAKNTDQLAAMANIACQEAVRKNKITIDQMCYFFELIGESKLREQATLIGEIACDPEFLEAERMVCMASRYSIISALSSYVLKCQDRKQVEAIKYIYFDENVRKRENAWGLQHYASIITSTEQEKAIPICDIVCSSLVMEHRTQQEQLRLVEKLEGAMNQDQVESMRQMAMNSHILQNRTIEEQLELMDSVVLIEDAKTITELQIIACHQGLLEKGPQEGQLLLMQFLLEEKVKNEKKEIASYSHKLSFLNKRLNMESAKTYRK